MMLFARQYFLQYAQELTCSEISDTYGLACLAMNEFPTACEAVFFFTALSEGASSATRLATRLHAWFADDWARAAIVFEGHESCNLIAMADAYPPRFKKAILAFAGSRMQPERELRTKRFLLRSALQSLRRANVDIASFALLASLSETELPLLLEGPEGDSLQSVDLSRAQHIARLAAQAAHEDDPSDHSLRGICKADSSVIARLRPMPVGQSESPWSRANHSQ